MGRLTAALNTPERLRPWAAAGVSHLLLGERAKDLRSAKAKTEIERLHQTTPPRPAVQGPPAVKPPGKAAPSRIFSPTKAEKHNAPAPSNELPEHWENIMKGIPSGVKILFTYFELGQDMGGAPDPVRRDLLATIIYLLRQPKGVIGFLPHTELVKEELTPKPDYFRQAATRLGVKAAAVFGENALEILIPDADKTRMIHTRNSMHFISMPSTEELRRKPFEQLLQDIEPLRAFLFGLD